MFTPEEIAASHLRVALIGELVKARQERGNTPLSGYLPVTDENIQVQVDLVLDEREIRMWKAE